jgi:hypothetical protein
VNLTVLTRRLAKAAEPLHSCAYYADEVKRFTEFGFSGWWHAYFAYRAAPMGAVSAQEVTVAFYNFAPRMVKKAVPSCWEVMSPRNVRQQQIQIMEEALHRIFKDDVPDRRAGYAAEALRETLTGLETSGRPLYEAWGTESWPESVLLSLWHAATLLREYRFDGHNDALRQADISGLGCHLMMAADGRGTPTVIQTIRGWTPTEWQLEAEKLRSRGWITAEGLHTELGRSVRRDIELATDHNAELVVADLGEQRSEKVLGALEGIAGFLIKTGTVPGSWPPKHLGQMGSA